MYTHQIIEVLIYGDGYCPEIRDFKDITIVGDRLLFTEAMWGKNNEDDLVRHQEIREEDIPLKCKEIIQDFLEEARIPRFEIIKKKEHLSYSVVGRISTHEFFMAFHIRDKNYWEKLEAVLDPLLEPLTK